tara:strand:- start:66 stop:479 length:414 start_codon:yes stop_codon:yes gene_type:complete
MSDEETKAYKAIKENGLVLDIGSKKDNSMVAQFEKLIDSIIDAKVQEAIQHMDLADRGYVDDRVQEEAMHEDTIRDMITDEIDAIDWNDRVSESGALDGVITEDTLESTLDEHRDGGEFVTQEELDVALGELSISRG